MANNEGLCVCGHAKDKHTYLGCVRPQGCECSSYRPAEPEAKAGCGCNDCGHTHYACGPMCCEPDCRCNRLNDSRTEPTKLDVSCFLCAEGNPRIRSSVTDAWVHVDTPIGRVICGQTVESPAEPEALEDAAWKKWRYDANTFNITPENAFLAGYRAKGEQLAELVRQQLRLQRQKIAEELKEIGVGDYRFNCWRHLAEYIEKLTSDGR